MIQKSSAAKSLILKGVFVLVLALGQAACAGATPTKAATANARTGVEKGAFLPCPGSPNCVSSMEASGLAAIAPFEYGPRSRDQALERLLNLLEADKNCMLAERRELQDGTIYLRAEYRSRIFRFVDDVEFLFPPESSLIHVKSASRVGYSDMGVNRKRVEDLRARFSRS